MTKVVPTILCGGSGTRLWPLSREDSPKQFHAVCPGQSLSSLQWTVQRHRAPGLAEPLLVTGLAHAGRVAEQLAEIQCAPRMICEPIARNTGPAVLAAAMTLVADDPDTVMIVLPSDHAVEGEINEQLLAMVGAANAGMIVTFGIEPRYPETGYGYITDDGAYPGHAGLRRVKRFVEKPPLSEAQALLMGGRSYWASGISMFRAQTIIDEYRCLDPHTFAAVGAALGRAETRGRNIVLDADAYAQATAEPTERAVFETSPAISLCPLDISWSDAGTWAAVYDLGQPDENGNVTSGEVVPIDTSNSLVKSSSRLVTVVGVTDLIVVDTDDALLITTRDKTQLVSAAVKELKNLKRREVSSAPVGNVRQLRDRRSNAAAASEIDVHDLAPGETLMLDAMLGPIKVVAISGRFSIGSADGPVMTFEQGSVVVQEGCRHVVRNCADSHGELLVMATRTIPANDPAALPVAASL